MPFYISDQNHCVMGYNIFGTTYVKKWWILLKWYDFLFQPIYYQELASRYEHLAKILNKTDGKANIAWVVIFVMYVAFETDHDDVIRWKHFPRYWPFVGQSTSQRWISLP